MHIGVFILLLLSGERNFGVRLNKPYTATIPMDIPVFTGTHADLLIVVFHKIITTGHQRLQPLFDCLLTILVNGESKTNNSWQHLTHASFVALEHLSSIYRTCYFLVKMSNSSIPVPENAVNGGKYQTAPSVGSLQHSLVPVFHIDQSPSRFLSIGNLQQHHPIPIRRQFESHLYDNQETSSIPQSCQPTQRLRCHSQIAKQTHENTPTIDVDESRKFIGDGDGRFATCITGRTGHA